MKRGILMNIQKVAYYILSFFCTDEEEYKYDESIPNLNYNLKTNRKYFNLINLLTFIYYTICISCPYFLTVYYGIYDKNEEGIAWASHIIYGCFAFISFVVEVIVHNYVYQQIGHTLPLINNNNIDSDDIFIFSKINMFFKNYPRLQQGIFYFLSLGFSQLARFDLYSDICFIVVCFKMESYIIGIISLIVIVGQLLVNICKLFYFLFVTFAFDEKRQLNTHEINSLCELSNLIEFEALNSILDKVAPYNISSIPNNFIFKSVFPQIAGKSISNRILVPMQKFFLEDVIQVILQITFIAKNINDLTVVISILTSILSLLVGFYKFMSIRPSSIKQLDFDLLSKKKKNCESLQSSNLIKYRNNMIEEFSEQIQMKNKINSNFQ